MCGFYVIIWNRLFFVKIFIVFLEFFFNEFFGFGCRLEVRFIRKIFLKSWWRRVIFGDFFFVSFL